MRLLRPLALLVLTASCLGCASASSSQVAIVDVQRAINETQGGAAARAQLRTMFQQRQAELDHRQAQLQGERAQLEAQATQHADTSAAQAQWQAELQQLQAEYQTDQQDLATAEQQMTNEIINRMGTLVEELRAQHDIDLVLEVNETGLVAHAPRVLDLTSALVALYDQRYPAPSMSAITAAPDSSNGAAPTQVVH